MLGSGIGAWAGGSGISVATDSGGVSGVAGLEGVGRHYSWPSHVGKYLEELRFGRAKVREVVQHTALHIDDAEVSVGDAGHRAGIVPAAIQFGDHLHPQQIAVEGQ